MFVSVCDRPSVAKSTEAQDRAVMETMSATIHRKMPIPARQLPITGSAHKAAVVGDAAVVTVLAGFDVTAKDGGAAGLDGRHRLELGETDMSGLRRAPGRPMSTEDVGNLQRRPHRRLSRRGPRLPLAV